MRMNPEALKAAVAPPPRPLALPTGFVDAAVLLPVWSGRLLFTVRSANLSHHAAQISFPGGRSEAGETAEHTALREAWEEVGLEPGSVEILGPLNPTLSPFGYRVFPLLGQLKHPPTLNPNPHEVSEVLWVPIEELIAAPAYSEERFISRANQPPLDPEDNQIAEPDRPWRRLVWHYPWRGYDIWGVTGNIVHDFVERVKQAW